jgi:glycerol-3-phosphate dehydrogenase
VINVFGGKITTYRRLAESDAGKDYAAEVRYLAAREWARTAEDVIWRRTKLGLKLTDNQVTALAVFMHDLPFPRQELACSNPAFDIDGCGC